MPARTTPTPFVVAIDMGYGHMRAAHALGEALDQPVLACDREPLADATDARRWRRWRHGYEWLTRSSATPVGAPLRPLVRMMTDIAPLEAGQDLSAPHWATRRLQRFAATKGLGARMVEHLQQTHAPLISTYFAPAIIADEAGHEPVYLVVTDTAVHRVWAPLRARETRINYCVPGPTARAYLEAYGVPPDRIHETGFPLPPTLADDAPRQANFEARLARLQSGSEPVRLVFAVGGAGTQSDMPQRFLPPLRPRIESGDIHITLVAGVRHDVRRAFERAIGNAGLTASLGKGLDVLIEPTLESYFARFHALLGESDVLWTKPSEMSFFAALGLPVLMAEPVGQHEHYNRDWLRSHGAGLDAGDPGWIVQRLDALRANGQLAKAARAGYTNLPHAGTRTILERVSR